MENEKNPAEIYTNRKTPDTTSPTEKKKVPEFIREFSKRESPEERKIAADSIRVRRAEHFSEKKKTKLRSELLSNEVERKTGAVQEQLRKIEDLKLELEGLNSSKLNHIVKYFEIKKLKADLVRGSRTYEQLLQERGVAISQKEFLEAQLKQEDPSGKLQEARKMLEEFYIWQKEKWAESDYSKEDIAEYFSEERLSSLSLEDYILLLKNFPKNMVTHVTRQGVRDHFGHGEHIHGVGEYTNGFMQILEKGRLQSALGIYLSEGLKKAGVDDFLNRKLTDGLKDLGGKKEALYWLNDFTAITPEERTEPGRSGTYGDLAAVHFATEEVADGYYGSERGNEIFFAFPSALIASQYYFSGAIAEHSGGTWNDQWVWANELKGININTGIVFIPEDARVDSTTGSRYELDSNKKPIIKEVTSQGDVLYSEAKNPISSRDFWENYFKLHPEQRPSKIVYYSGGDPTKAMLKWREDNGITKKSKSSSLGFPEHHRDQFSSEATPGMERFRSIATKIIEEYFDNQPVPS